MDLQLSTAQDVFLIIVTVAIALFFVAAAVLAIASTLLVKKVKEVVQKAEDAIDSVESAAETLRDLGNKAGGPLAALKTIAHIVDSVSGAKGKKK